jgi:hypothetical protein
MSFSSYNLEFTLSITRINCCFFSKCYTDCSSIFYITNSRKDLRSCVFLKSENEIFFTTSTTCILYPVWFLSCYPFNLTIIWFCLTLLDIGGHSLYGHRNPSIDFSGWWCYILTYFLYVCFSAFYYSFILQAIFRLFFLFFLNDFQ